LLLVLAVRGTRGADLGLESSAVPARRRSRLHQRGYARRARRIDREQSGSSKALRPRADKGQRLRDEEPRRNRRYRRERAQTRQEGRRGDQGDELPGRVRQTTLRALWGVGCLYAREEVRREAGRFQDMLLDGRRGSR